MSKLANAYAKFRDGWLKNLRNTWFVGPYAKPGGCLTPAEASHEWCKHMQNVAYKELQMIEHQTPRFVVTNFATAENDKNVTLGLTTWACTEVDGVVVDPQKFVYDKTCTKKPARRQKETMHRIACRIDNDWIVIPILSLFLRWATSKTAAEFEVPITQNVDHEANLTFELEIDMVQAGTQMKCLRDNGGGHIGLIEIDTPRMPVLQFANKDTGAPMHLAITRFEKMNALRVGNRLLDPIHGNPMTGKRRVNLLDVELTMFLLWNWYKDQGHAAAFEAEVYKFMKTFRAEVAKQKEKTKEAVCDAVLQNMDLDDLVAEIEGAKTEKTSEKKKKKK